MIYKLLIITMFYGDGGYPIGGSTTIAEYDSSTQADAAYNRIGRTNDYNTVDVLKLY